MKPEQTFFNGPPRADLNKPDFDNLVHQKGREVIHETALQCPCKSRSTNQQSNCRNCGGSGWVFINPKRTRMVLTAIDIANDYRPWSEELRGVVNITALVEDELSLMDKITALDAESIHNEVVYFDEVEYEENIIFAYSTYHIKEILYIGLFSGENAPLRRLELGIDYTIERNIIKLIKPEILTFSTVSENNITIRYKHAPQFHVIEMKRDTMQSTIWKGTEQQQSFPVSAMGKRAHYQLNAENLNHNRLLDNSFIKNKCQ